MYQSGPTAAAGAASGLAATGMAAQSLWLFLAGFALLALGAALWRMTPRKQA
jgi:LPXTG-motif cell wall-anchored protein